MDIIYQPLVLNSRFVQHSRTRDVFDHNNDGPSSAVTILCSIVIPIICCFGIFGNGVSFIVLCRRELKGSIFLYLSVLAFCNMCTSLMILLGALSYSILLETSWPIYLIIYGTPVSGFLNTLTVLTTVILSLDRCLILADPVRLTKPGCCRNRFAIRLMVACVVFSVVFNIPNWFLFRRDQIGLIIMNTVYYTNFYKIYVWTSFVFLGILPTILLFFGNGFLIFSLHKIVKKRLKINNQKSTCPALKRHCIDLTVILIVIVFFFLVTEIPRLIIDRTSAGRIFFDMQDPSNFKEDEEPLNTCRLIWLVGDAIILALYFVVYYKLCPPFKRVMLRMSRTSRIYQRRKHRRCSPDVKMNIFVINGSNNLEKSIKNKNVVTVDLPNPEKLIEILNQHHRNGSFSSMSSEFQYEEEGDDSSTRNNRETLMSLPDAVTNDAMQLQNFKNNI